MDTAAAMEDNKTAGSGMAYRTGMRNRHRDRISSRASAISCGVGLGTRVEKTMEVTDASRRFLSASGTFRRDQPCSKLPHTQQRNR
jgi:hypothetical protein